MTSIARRDANRRNAQRSTGPRTPAGKATSSKNALQHGLLAAQTLLPDEDADALTALSTGLIDQLAPSRAARGAVGHAHHQLRLATPAGLAPRSWRHHVPHDRSPRGPHRGARRARSSRRGD